MNITSVGINRNYNTSFKAELDKVDVEGTWADNNRHRVKFTEKFDKQRKDIEITVGKPILLVREDGQPVAGTFKGYDLFIGSRSGTNLYYLDTPHKQKEIIYHPKFVFSLELFKKCPSYANYVMKTTEDSFNTQIENNNYTINSHKAELKKLEDQNAQLEESKAQAIESLENIKNLEIKNCAS